MVARCARPTHLCNARSMDRSANRAYLVGAGDFTVAHEVLAKFVVVALLFAGRAAKRERIVLSRWARLSVAWERWRG